MLITMIFALSMTFGFGSDYKCRQVSLKSEILSLKEKVEFCFLKDESYFISRNCLDMSCKFIQTLRQKGLSHSVLNRPGLVTCTNLDGAYDTFKIKKSDKTYLRCVFKEDRSSISLNLLESWNGKHFEGPGDSLKF